MMRPARILHVDCDQFFVQCARIADPEGAGRTPLLLVGGSASHRGVVTSASYETRAFGVRSGMPTGRALRLCPQAKVVPVPRALCMRKSRDVRAVLERFSPVVEPASVDEAYIDMSGTEALYHGESLRDTALRMQADVLAGAAIHVSIGGAATRMIAKLAAGRAKPGGVCIVDPGDEAAFMRGLRLSDIPGVGPVFAAALERLGLVTVEDALRHALTTLEQWLGPGRGQWLYHRVRGEDAGGVHPEREARSMSREETFAKDLFGDDALETALLALAVRLGADLRGDGLRARTVTVKLRDADFRTRQASRTVPDGVALDRALYALARELLRRLRRARRTGARLLGIAASNLQAGGGDQADLFADALESERDRRLAQASDQLRRRFGPRALLPGRLLEEREHESG